jgi:hypothetical protein
MSYSLFPAAQFSVAIWIPACAGMTEHQNQMFTLHEGCRPVADAINNLLGRISKARQAPLSEC